MVSRKGVYPYDLVDSVTMFDQTKLPPKKVFHSKLNDSDISDEDYEHANNLRNDFKMKTISDYHDLYLNSDIFCLEMCLKRSETSVLRSTVPGILPLLY